MLGSLLAIPQAHTPSLLLPSPSGHQGLVLGSLCHPSPPPCTLGWHSSIPAAGSLGKTGSLHSENPSSTTVPGVFTGPSLSPTASLETSCSWMGELWDRED